MYNRMTMFFLCIILILNCAALSEMLDNLHLQIDMFGIEDKLHIQFVKLKHNGATYMINVSMHFHKNNETFMYCSELSEISTSDTVCLSSSLKCTLLDTFNEFAIGSMICGTQMKYDLHVITQNIETKKLKESDILLQFIKIVHWRNLVLFYQNKTEKVTSSLIDELSDIGICVSMVNTDRINGSELSNYIIQSFKETSNMLVICYAACIHSVLQLVNKMDRTNLDFGALIQRETKWIVLSMDHTNSSFVPSVSHNISNIAVIESSDRFVHICNGNTIISSEDLIVNKSYSKDELQNAIKATGIASIVKTYAGMQSFKVQTLMFTRKGRQLVNVPLKTNLSEILLQGELFPNTKYGFNQKQLLVTTLEWRPFNEKISEGNYTGFTMFVLQRLAHQLNFTFRIVEPEDGQWGIKKNDSWTGMIGLLEDRKVDIVAAPLTVTYDRSQTVDFLYPIFFDTNRIVIGRPIDDDDNKWRTLIDIFSGTVLAYIAASIIFVTIFLCFVEKVNPYYFLEKNKEKSRLSKLSDCVWYNYGALLTQVAKDELPFTTMSGMVQQEKYKWGLYGHGAMHSYLSESTLPIHQEVWNGIVGFNHSDPSVLMSSEDKQFDKVIRGNYAYFAVNLVAQYYKVRGFDILILPEIIATIPNAFALQKNSPYEEMFSREIMRMHENGLIDTWLKAGYPPSTQTTIKFQAKVIEFKDLQSAFYLIGIGVTSGVISWILERILHRSPKCNFRKTKGSVKLHRMQSFDLTAIQ
ncbi:glutamate receptor ionotropic, kainate 4-like isoform X2 [Mytilus galloprovincialis]|uniref:glutamate receptor ionotropic, kainate 4-like isoform X2 n=1 Tax=Mytilus galloprovincialis TaxID=29158 RepID=UPI003F7C6991